MTELPDRITTADVARPQILQESNISNAQTYNQRVKQSNIIREKNLNPIPRSEDVNIIIRSNQKLVNDQKQKGKEDKKFTSDITLFGSISPYPNPNNFLLNKRTGNKTTSWKK